MNQHSLDLPKTFPQKKGNIEIFDEFFDSQMEESVSPFLKASSRKWGKNLSLKASIFAAFLLVFAFIFSFFPTYKALSFLCLLFAYFLAGIPALIASIEDIFNFEINIDVLMTLAAFLSIIIGSGIEGALLLVLFSFSGAMEDAVRSKAKGAIKNIKKMAPTKAYVVDEEGIIFERSVRDILPGTKILVKSGEIVPLDGIVISGSSTVNLVHLTGENAPILKKEGDEVASGARNLEGALVLSVIRTSSDSTVAQIIKLIMQAQAAKPRLERLFDKISSKYAILIISLSLFFALSFPFLFSIPFIGTEGSIYRALTFLIAASPCALIIALPIAYLSAVSVCARNGILLKGGVILDSLATCSALAFDKTGTLTKGELTYVFGKQIRGNNLNENEALSLAYSLEINALHPIAKAIVNAAELKKLSLLTIEEFKTNPGFGLEGLYQGKKVYLGNKDFILPKIQISSLAVEEAYICSFLLYEDQVFAFYFKDVLRPGVKQTLASLKERWKMRFFMLTGDHYESAKIIAQEAGINEFYSDLRPSEKLKMIDEFSKKENLAMVGDGINDAPSLARATVGISMGKKGSATAIDASDIILLHDNIESLSWLIAKSHATRKIVWQNLGFALLAIVMATVPALLGWIPLWIAVIMHEGGTVIVGLNALRLLRN